VLYRTWTSFCNGSRDFVTFPLALCPSPAAAAFGFAADFVVVDEDDSMPESWTAMADAEVCSEPLAFAVDFFNFGFEGDGELGGGVDISVFSSAGGGESIRTEGVGAAMAYEFVESASKVGAAVPLDFVDFALGFFGVGLVSLSESLFVSVSLIATFATSFVASLLVSFVSLVTAFPFETGAFFLVGVAEVLFCPASAEAVPAGASEDTVDAAADAFAAGVLDGFGFSSGSLASDAESFAFSTIARLDALAAFVPTPLLVLDGDALAGALLLTIFFCRCPASDESLVGAMCGD